MQEDKRRIKVIPSHHGTASVPFQRVIIEEIRLISNVFVI